MSVLNIFVASFCLAAFAGLAALLRSGLPLNRVTIASAFLNSGFLGLGLSLLWYHKYQSNLYFLVGVCLLAGLGGNTTLEFALQVFKAWSTTFRLGKTNPPTEEMKLQ